MSMSDTVHDDHPRTLTILFATETGTAQDIADRVAMQCRRIHVQARVLSMDSYSPVCSELPLTGVDLLPDHRLS